MFGLGLLLIYGLVPAALILLASALSVEGRLTLLFLVFPLVLLAVTLLWDRRRAGE